MRRHSVGQALGGLPRHEGARGEGGGGNGTTKLRARPGAGTGSAARTAKRAKRAKTAPPRDTAQRAPRARPNGSRLHSCADFLGGVDARVITGGGDGGARAGEKARELKQELCELIKRHGGAHSEAQHAGVTHVICDPSATNGVAFNAAKKSGLDVLTPGWLRDCVDAGAVIEPRPKHRLHLSRATVEERGR